MHEPGKGRPDGEARIYADERGEYLAFKVTDDRLVTRLAAVEVIRDMVTLRNIGNGSLSRSAAPWNSGARHGLKPARAD
jgi:hypothetical protein